MNVVAESLLLGLLVGLFAWLTDLGQTDLILYSVGLYVIANIVTLSPLRHSHIDLRLGPMEWLFLSPAHHQ
jgi:sterol desaturase/sphingolipid hydroxylase (fatty acid hydroxylase superfamily)